MWPTKPDPQSLAGIMGLFLVGCVSIKTHEQAKQEAYIAGERDMALRYIRSIENGATNEEVLFDLKGVVDVAEMKEKRGKLK